MVIQNDLARLSAAANQLNQIAKELEEMVDAVNRTLRETAAPGVHMHRVPISEESFSGDAGREIVLSFLVFKPIDGLRQLGITQRRVFESRLAGQQNPSRHVETPLANADLNLQRLAIERLPEFVNQVRTDGGHAEDVEDLFDDAPTRLVSVKPR